MHIGTNQCGSSAKQAQEKALHLPCGVGQGGGGTRKSSQKTEHLERFRFRHLRGGGVLPILGQGQLQVPY